MNVREMREQINAYTRVRESDTYLACARTHMSITDLAHSGNKIEAMPNEIRTIYVIYLIADAIVHDCDWHWSMDDAIMSAWFWIYIYIFFYFPEMQ